MFKIENTVKRSFGVDAAAPAPPQPYPEVSCRLTEKQWLEAEGSDEVIPARDHLNFPLISHLKEKYTAGSWCASPHCSRKVPCQGATVEK